MIKRSVLRALAHSAETGAEDPRAGGADPFLRPFVRGRVRDALAQARRATSVDDDLHVRRLAYVRAAGRGEEVSPDDRDAVFALFQAVEASAPAAIGRAFWPVTTLLVLAVVATAGGLLLRALRPLGDDRFRDTAMGKACGRPLTKYSLALGKEPSNRIAELRGLVLTNELRAQIGDEAFAAYGALLDTAAKVDDSPVSEKDAAKPVFAAANTLAAKLQAKGIAGQLEPNVRAWDELQHVELHAYYADRRVEITARDATFKVLWGRQVDNVGGAPRGAYKHEDSDWVVISVDEIEDVLFARYLSVWLRDKPLPLGYGGASEALLLTERTLGERLGAEIAAASGLDKATAQKIQPLVERREAALKRLEEKKWFFGGSAAVQMPWSGSDLLDDLRKKEFEAEDAFHANELLRQYEAEGHRARDLAVALEEEEFVTALAIGPKGLALSDALRKAGATPKTDLARLDARLSAIAHLACCTTLALARSADGVLRGADPVDVLVLTELERELGLPKPGQFARSEEMRDDLGATLDGLLAKSPDDVRAAAGRVRERLFGAPPPPYARKVL